MATKSTTKKSDEKDTNKPAAGERVDDGTGLESLAVDREAGGPGLRERVETDTKTPKGNINAVTQDEDGNRMPPIEGVTVIGRAESGEPIIAGGVPTMTTGVPASARGTQDPNLGVVAPTDTALVRHEATRDDWGALEPEDSDGTPADRNKVLHGASKKEAKQAAEADPRQTVENQRNQPDA